MGLSWSSSPVTVGTEVTATITFTDDDVVWAYVDWDDGEDNSLDNAIYHWERLKTDSKSVELTHIYTKVGTFYPVIRTVNSSGFMSKFLYSGGTTTNLPEPNEAVTGINGIVINDGVPNNIIRLDKKIVKSGIDNEIFDEGPKNVYLYKAPILASGNAAVNTRTTVQIKFIDAMSNYIGALPEQYDADWGVTSVIREEEVNVTGSLVKVPASGQVARILEVKQKTAKSLSTSNADVNDANKVKTFLIASSSATNQWHPITYVSNGDPIKRDSERKVKLDFTQSRARASNKDISSYYYDTGKIFFDVSSTRWQASSSGGLTNDTKTGSSTLDLSYTYMAKPDGVKNDAGAAPHAPFHSGNNFWWSTAAEKVISDQFPINDWNQFYDQHYLTRVNANTEQNIQSTLSTFDFVYRICPTISTSAGVSGNNSLFIDAATSMHPVKTANYTSGAYYNGTSYPINISGWNNQTFGDTQGEARNISEFLVLADSKKRNKIFFNITPYAVSSNTGVASGNTSISGTTVAGVFYLKTGTLKEGDQFTEYARWVPVEFRDTTKITREIRDASNSKFTEYSDSFAKPGTIEFDMPLDWGSVTASGLAGGIFNRTSAPGSEPTNPYAKDIVADFDSSFTGPTYNVYEVSTSSLSDYTDDQIGSFRYTYEVTWPSASFKNYLWWVASSNTAANRLYLVSGQTIPWGTITSGTNVSGVMRKVNIYDVFDGAVKFGSEPPLLGDVPYASSSVYPHSYMWSGTDNRDMIESSFSGGVYPLKIVLSGNNFEDGATAGVELWDALPFNDADSQVVIQRDNTAFDLTFMELTSNINVTYAGTYYSTISKNGKMTIIRTGTPIQNISFNGVAMGDEQTFSYSEEYKSYNTLHKLRRIEAEAVRVMWDEKQKDGTYVRFFGYINSVSETHQVGGNRASKPYSFTMVVEEICLIDSAGNLMSDILPLGGVSDANTYS